MVGSQKKKQKGFTLIEIIAVIVLLGVLAAVLVPKFVGLTEDARKRALAQAIAEGQARINQSAAKYLLSSGAVPSPWAAANLGGLADETSGDYTLKYSLSGTSVTITAGYTNSAVYTQTLTGEAALPQ